MASSFSSLTLFKKIGVVSGAIFVGLVGIGMAAGTQSPSTKTLPQTDPSQGIHVDVPTPKVEADTIETKDVSETSEVPFTTSTQNDAALASGTRTTKVAGVNGVDTKVYKVTYRNDVETDRELTSDIVTTAPVNEVIAIGTYIAPQPVYSPSSPTVPAGASAICRDGTPSYSAHRSGTCSHHGGVAEWL